MQCNVNVLMNVYNEAEFVSYALQACLPYVKSVTVVEGAYKEAIAVGASPRSTDGTVNIVKSFFLKSLFPSVKQKMYMLEANEKSDPHQRNVGLRHIQEMDPNGWLLIIDGDEVYEPFTFRMIEALTRKMNHAGAKAAYFKSLTFVNDFEHYCEQEFPRLFKLTPDCSFVNDNYVQWGNKMDWAPPTVIKAPNIHFHHYSFCKGKERFDLKKRWWETRFGRPFEYSWHLDENGDIVDNNHVIKPYRGKHPEIICQHPLMKK